MRRHNPVSSYRLQFSAQFGFDAAARLVPYLDALGVTDCYASPLLESVSGSEHGYDISNHDALNPALGGDEAFLACADALRQRDMGLILDVVPNHMGLDERSNRWWRDVLQHGPDSPYATFFDITWNPTASHPRGRVLLPILEDGYGDVLHRGEITVVVDDGTPLIAYYSHRLPLAPESLEGVVAGDAARHFNGEPGRPSSWDRLHDLLERQWYRIAHWKTSFDEINYRRFFDVNQLGALRMEDAAVFEATHRKVLALIEAGLVTGLRIDHPDGLLDPKAYFERLQAAIAALSPGDNDSRARFHVVAEKILSRGELLQQSWPIAGTTGYGFLNDLNGIFVARDNARAMHVVYVNATDRRESFETVAYHSRRMIAGSALASELWVLTRTLKQLAEHDRRTRDFTTTTLSRTISEVVACMPIYRTYVTEDGYTDFDRAAIDAAVDEARRRNPVLIPAAFLFLRQVLLADASPDEALLDEKRRFAMKFQQFTAPVRAKGIEDTAFYREHTLVSLNEVGGDPGRFGASVDDFHGGNQVRLEQWPREMTSTATHDSKRGEDGRARLNVLSEMPQEWRRAVMQWRRINTLRRTAVDRESAPDPNDEYLFYQSLVAAWPAEPSNAPVPVEATEELAGRIRLYMLKAIREAKTHTSWLNQNRAYEDATALFVDTTLRGPTAARFLKSFVPFAREIGAAGMVNSLAQVVLKIAAPGVPDFYQGTELWQFDLADPDNRRAIDFDHRMALMSELREWLAMSEAGAGHELAAFVSAVAGHWWDGKIKMFVTAAGLRHRRASFDLFVNGSYEPLRTSGEGAEHIVAFARRHGNDAIIAAVPRLSTTLLHHVGDRRVGGVWQNIRIALPDTAARRYRHLFTNERFEADGAGICAADVFRACPVAILIAED